MRESRLQELLCDLAFGPNQRNESISGGVTKAHPSGRRGRSRSHRHWPGVARVSVLRPPAYIPGDKVNKLTLDAVVLLRVS